VVALVAFARAEPPQLKPIQAELVSLTALAHELFRDYLLPFEIVGLLLLVAVIGATIVARKPPQADVTEGYDPARTLPHPEDSAP